MDGTTEPVVAVIGHPIAGNPTQFALECGFAHAAIDCRVLSFDVPDDRLAEALTGLEALQFLGVWFDPTRRDLADQWLQHRGEGSTAPDALMLADGVPRSRWRPIVTRDHVWPELVAGRLLQAGVSLQRVVVVGEEGARRQQILDRLVEPDGALRGIVPEQIQVVSRFTRGTPLVDVNLIVLASNTAAPWDLLQERLASPMTEPLIVVDLGEGWESSSLRWWESAGSLITATWIDRIAIHAALLAEVTRQWLGCEVPREVFGDAIEEYLAL